MIPSKTVSPVNAQALIAYARVEKSFFEAMKLAVKLYEKQKRDFTKIKYVSRPLTVASLLLEYKYPAPVLVAGVLSEVLVRTTLKPSTLRTQFGDEVADMVELLTQPVAANGIVAAEAFEAYVARIAGASPDVQSIKMAELLEALCAIPKAELPSRFAFINQCAVLAEALSMANEGLSRRVSAVIRMARS